MTETAAAKSAYPWKMAVPLVAVAVLAIAWTGFWFWASARAESAFHDWRIRLADQGSDLSCGEVARGGYPFRIEVRCSAPVIRASGTDDRIAAQQFDIIAQAYNRDLVIARWTGPTVFSTLGAEQFTMTHLPWLTSIRLAGGTPEQVSSLVRDIGLTSRGHDVLSAGEANVHVRRSGSGALGLAGHATDIGFSGALARLPPVDRIEASGSLEPAPPNLRGPLQMYLREAAARGSEVKIATLSVMWAGVALAASGTVRLERTGLIDGTLDTTVTGLDEFIARLDQAGVIGGKGVQGAAVLFGLFKRDENGALKLKIALRDGEVYFGPIRLFKHGPLF